LHHPDVTVYASKQCEKNWIINTAVRQWRTRRRVYVKAEGDHFEHKLP